jgi:hypothetical protein
VRIELFTLFLEAGTGISGEIARVAIFRKKDPVLIGTGDNTVTAAHAFVLVHPNNAVFPLFSSTGGTDLNAGRILAVITADRIGSYLDAPAAIHLPGNKPGPGNMEGQKVLYAAGRHASMAANALGKIYYHPPSHEIDTLPN